MSAGASLLSRNGRPVVPTNGAQKEGGDVELRWRGAEATAEVSDSDSDGFEYGRGKLSDAGFVSSSGSYRRNLSRTLILTYRVMQVAGYLPVLSIEQRLPHRRSTRLLLRKGQDWRQSGVQALLRLFVLALIAFNVWVFKMFVELAVRFQTLFRDDHLHALTVGAIIASVKPVINIMGFIIFGFRVGVHKRLLKRMSEVQKSFSLHFGHSNATFRATNVAMLSSVVITFSTIFALRLSMYIEMNEQPGRIANDLSLISAPLLSVWNVIPLVYFLQCHVLIRNWGHQLASNIRHNYRIPARIRQGVSGSGLGSPETARSRAKHDLKFYYRHFSQLTDLQMAASEFFNPYIAFTFLWSMFTLCLTIYFVINAGDSYDDPPVVLNGEGQMMWRKVIHYNFGWVGIQIFLGLAHMLCICDAGRRTNEETRAIMNTVLSAMLDFEPTPADHAYIQCFTGKIRLQGTWGASVWRAFPLERGSFLQLGTIIMSYAMILLKFRGEMKGVPAAGFETTTTAAPHSAGAAPTVRFQLQLSL